jgi:hypothetical protein
MKYTVDDTIVLKPGITACEEENFINLRSEIGIVEGREE